jgi:hypothetical protein
LVIWKAFRVFLLYWHNVHLFDIIVFSKHSLFLIFVCVCVFFLQLIWPRILERKTREIESVKCPHNYLKVVEISGYYGGSSDFELAMYFIENATVLEKLIIDPRCQTELCGMASIIENWEAYENLARYRAEQQLKSEVPSRIKLEIL